LFSPLIAVEPPIYVQFQLQSPILYMISLTIVEPLVSI